MDQIEMKGIAAFGYHGVLPQERELGQRFYADITLETDMTAIGRSDEIADGVNYAEVYQTAQKILTGAPVNTLEALVTNINAAIYARTHWSARSRRRCTSRRRRWRDR